MDLRARGAELAAGVAAALRSLARGAARCRRRVGSRLGRSAGGGLAGHAAAVPRRQGRRHAQRRAEGDGRLCLICADDGGRRRRSGGVHQDRFPRRRAVLAPPHRPQRSLRHPRARHGRDRQWARRARRHSQALWLHLSCLLRLHARLGAALCPHGAAGGVGLDARLRGPRRGRAHASAHRALRRRCARSPGCG